MQDNEISKTEKQNREDMVVNRLLLTFFAALVLVLILSWFNNSIHVIGFVINVQPWLKWVCLALTVAAGAWWFISSKSGKDYSAKVITPCGIFWSVFTLSFAVFTYNLMYHAEIKSLIVIGIAALLAFVYNIFGKYYLTYTALSVSAAVAAYYLDAENRVSEGIINTMADISFIYLIVLAGLMLVLFVVLALNKYSLKAGKAEIKLPLGRCIPLLVLAGFALILIFTSLFIPAVIVYTLIAFAVYYIVVGVLCTTKSI